MKFLTFSQCHFRNIGLFLQQLNSGAPGRGDSGCIWKRVSRMLVASL